LTSGFLFRISIRVGSHFNDLTELEQLELNEPSGWVVVPLRDPTSVEHDERPVRAFMIQIAILSNHQNGRDTHMRHIKIHAPVQDSLSGVRRQPAFTSVEMMQRASIR
jgi:anaphase-promoting complex subunit 10